jgi:predicted TIM-barrel fold metal-dependent hydrolase
MNNAARIDVHQHLLPHDYVAWLRGKGIHAAGGWPIPDDWTPGATVELMDSFEIGTGILSLAEPSVNLGDTTESRVWARWINETHARVMKDHPGRFGMFATVPLPDIDGALAELAEAYDSLGADGVVLLANYQGTYLGDPRFDPLMAELDRRAAVVFVHPGQLPGPPIEGLPAAAVDFLLDTTRAATNMVFHDVPRRYPGIRFILSHGGGFVPYASHRIALAANVLMHRDLAQTLEDLSGFYFDTALSSTSAALPSLLSFAKPGHVLFGSDWPFAPEAAIGYFAGQLDAYPQADEAIRAGINRENALELFPHFA